MAQLPAAVIVTGVSGSGKTTIAALLAGRLHWEFEEGDGFHPAANVAKMHGGVPLTDEDRWPWLHAIAAWIDETRRAGRHGVVACSALKRRYQFEALEEPGSDENPIVVSIDARPIEIASRIVKELGA